MTGFSFVKVDGGETFTLGEFDVNCNEDEEGTGWAPLADAINTYTSVGSFDKSYVYLPQWLAEVLSEDLGYTVTKGWYNSTDEAFENNCNSTTLTFGNGVIAKSTVAGAAVTYSGAVKATPTVTDVAAFSILNNAAPAQIKLGDIVVNCNEEEEGTGWAALADVINTYTTSGSFNKSYVYLPQWLAEVLSEDLGYTVTKGWYDAADEAFENNCNETVLFGPGVGFVAKSTVSGATLTIKSALAN